MRKSQYSPPTTGTTASGTALNVKDPGIGEIVRQVKMFFRWWSGVHHRHCCGLSSSSQVGLQMNPSQICVLLLLQVRGLVHLSDGA